ncbi:complement regulator-acquiring protein (plasmid) [Borrelia anserina]|uniref:complement regulator-acquiring protein n=1 Tax=Borrelia anserina TaxID=143 RepID=UPI00094F0D18|nr:complement regulator-acquiring protein [Borrelia anserina]UPA07292.1 complement regulator-acquiring protein [Borrelia anserina]
MRNYFFIKSFLIIFSSTSCKSDLNENKTNLFNQKNQANWTQSIQKDDRIESLQTNIKDKRQEKVPTKETQILVDSLKTQIQNVTALIEKDKENIQKNEPADQFGMKNGAFKMITGNPSTKAYNNPDSQCNRRQFYSSINYDEEKIRQLGMILNQITADTTNRGQLHIDITNAGRAYSQFLFERVIDKTKEVQEKLNLLPLKDLKKITIKIDAIIKLKLLWQNTVDNIINDYNNDTNGIKTDSQKLIEHIKEKYGKILKQKIPRIGIIASEINKILKTLK